MDELFVRNRITALRINKGVSEYKMSIDLGHSKSYIQSISSGKAMPSFTEFLYICEYLGVSPKDFFDAEIQNPVQVCRLTEAARKLPTADLELLISLAKRIGER